jgi:lipoate-protein ligase B
MNGKSKSSRRWFCMETPSIDYREAWELQLALVEAKRSHPSLPDVVFLLEHPPVFTLGHRGGRDHLKVSEDFMAERGIPLIHVERGGDITYHGPGQLVGYLIVNLKAHGWRVLDFVEALEEVMIRSLADWGIRSGRNSMNRGVWVGTSKIGSLGIAVRGGVSFHGFALNVNTWLEPFQWIDPCGLEGIQVTSMKRILGREIPMEEVRYVAARHIREGFGVELEMVSVKDIHRLLDAKARGIVREAA